MTGRLERLNTTQRAAATVAALPLVLASAGSGNTGTLIRRVVSQDR